MCACVRACTHTYATLGKTVTKLIQNIDKIRISKNLKFQKQFLETKCYILASFLSWLSTPKFVLPLSSYGHKTIIHLAMQKWEEETTNLIIRVVLILTKYH